jgi:hypothetical protein
MLKLRGLLSLDHSSCTEKDLLGIVANMMDVADEYGGWGGGGEDQ